MIRYFVSFVIPVGIMDFLEDFCSDSLFISICLNVINADVSNGTVILTYFHRRH